VRANFLISSALRSSVIDIVILSICRRKAVTKMAYWPGC
jgi:hypothetical protein